MVNNRCKDHIIQYVLEASLEETERLAVFISRWKTLRAETREPEYDPALSIPVRGSALLKRLPMQEEPGAWGL
ncbi:MAG: hypothetical protein LBQ30_02890 [Treponema sp.]|jgi:hypothetical protein|nr:hypothetical protein [Treponema sp.]